MCGIISALEDLRIQVFGTVMSLHAPEFIVFFFFYVEGFFFLIFYQPTYVLGWFLHSIFNNKKKKSKNSRMNEL